MDETPKDGPAAGGPSCDGGAAMLLARDEQAVLQVLRYLCLTYARPQAHSWEQALVLAADAFGPAVGGEVAVAVMQLMRAIRVTRRTTFRFRDPHCPCCRSRLSEAEAKVITLVRAARKDPARPARVDALILTEGAPTAAVLAEAERLAAVLDRRLTARAA
ncbi:hypothetical protein [Pannonibacter tanglangensis]|uniref:Uncharacterized protein n=1 Tax=Pannonibacter tanglangensis TaxID=2750084 RepID=A0ABW9ZGW1_9HYPH|nr:hypothetical protein [Pannonibacter sp. XCT-34]NBN63661.1 hypothetical protein [Pannonibacter sp. XCT-34]